MRRSGEQQYPSYSKSVSCDTYKDEESDRSFDRLVDGNMLLEMMKSIRRRKKKQSRKNNTYISSTSNSDNELCESADRSPAFISKDYKATYGDRLSPKQNKKHVRKVHEELRDIYEKLRDETERLQAWDLELKKKESHLNDVEKQLSDYANCMKVAIEHEATKRYIAMEKTCETKMQQLEEENRRSRGSFKIIKKANESLKSKVADYESKLKSNEEKQSSMQSRILNLQRKIELLNQQINEQSAKFNSIMKEKPKTVNKNYKDHGGSKQKFNTFFEAFAILMQWISETHLKQSICSSLKVGTHFQAEHDINVELTNSRATKVIIFLPNVLENVSSTNGNIQLAFIQFIYWSLLHLHMTQSQHRFSHSATYRRIGEYLFQAGKVSEENISSQSFFRSSDYRIRLISSLIIVHTLTQADILAQVFQSINIELKHELSKELFLEYRGAEVFLPFFKLTSKVSLCHVVDILMLLAVESPYQQQFVTQLGSVEWIQAILVIMKACHEDISLIEKLSLLLQRISKLQVVKPIFDALQVKSSVTELSRLPGCAGEYLQLNLRSILFNIESMRTQK